jgi:hypothetical protein
MSSELVLFKTFKFSSDFNKFQPKSFIKFFEKFRKFELIIKGMFKKGFKRQKCGQRIEFTLVLSLFSYQS